MRVNSVRQLVQILGGPSKAGLVLGVIPQKVVNWRAVNRIPAHYFFAHQVALAERRITAPPRLWRQTGLLPPSQIERISDGYEARRPRRTTRSIKAAAE